MRPTEFSADMIVALLRKQTVASLSEVMAALGTGARRTAFRKLKGLATRTSYSHRGGYYTLDERVEFDQRGLWSFDGVRFPAHHLERALGVLGFHQTTRTQQIPFHQDLDERR